MVEGARQADLGELRGAVDSLVGQPPPAGLAGDGDDVRRVALEQLGQRRADGVDEPLDVDVDHLVELVHGQIEERSIGADAGIANDDIELAKALDSRA